MIVVTNKTLGPNYSPQLLNQEWMALSGIFVLICVIIPLLCKVIAIIYCRRRQALSLLTFLDLSKTTTIGTFSSTSKEIKESPIMTSSSSSSSRK